MAKRVLLICGSELCNAGVPNVIMTIVRGLRTSYDFDILCLSEKSGNYDNEFSSYGGKIYRMALPDYSSNKVFYPLRLFKVGKKIRELLRHNKYDVIHCNCGVDSGICLLIARWLGVQVRIGHAHGTYSRKGRNYILRAYIFIQKRLIAANATKLLACSNIAGETLFCGKKFENILNPVNVEIYKAVKKHEHSGIHLLQIGYYCENKNQLFSLRLLESLQMVGIDCTLHFIGFPSDKDYYAKIKQYVVDNKLGECVCFLPADTDKVEEFSWADYALLPSGSEGLPLVALEAQSANTICLMSDHVPVDSNIGLGFFLSYDNVEEWVKAITDLTTVSQNGGNQVVVDVSRECYLRKMEIAYERS